MNISRFQKSIATGRFTLPVTVLICLLLWIIDLGSWSDLANFCITLLTGYQLIETNTAFSVIRTRTTFHVSCYWLLVSGLFALHPYEWSSWIPILFMTSVYYLFKSYESYHTSIHLFNVSFSIALGSLIFPQAVYFLPLFLLGAIVSRSLNIKSFFAFLLGCATPYWFMFGYAYLNKRVELFYTQFAQITRFEAIDYTHVSQPMLLSWLAICVVLLVCSIHLSRVSYQDKTRTRVYLTFITVAGWWAALFIALQPQSMYPILFIQLICTSFLAAHLFILTRNRFSGIFFIVTMISMIALTCYNLWI